MKRNIIDIHTHIGFYPTTKNAEDELKKYVNENKISFCLLSFDGTEITSTNSDRTRIVSQLIAYTKALEFAKQDFSKFGILLWVQPNTKTSMIDIDKFIQNNRNNIYGIKMHPRLSNLHFTDEKFIPYFRLAECYNLPILFNFENDEFSNIKEVESILKSWPHILFIGAHSGLNIKKISVIKLLKKYDNFYVDTSLLNELDFEQIYNEKLIDKIVFGSDMPKHNSIEPTEFFKFFIENKKGLSEEDYNKLIYLNAKKVFDIKI